MGNNLLTRRGRQTTSFDLAGQCRIACARIPAKHGVSKPVEYPDFSTKEKAQAIIKPFVDGKRLKLL
jgi:formate-dependent nitrite reductase cytochrome c552 subunit